MENVLIFAFGIVGWGKGTNSDNMVISEIQICLTGDFIGM